MGTRIHVSGLSYFCTEATLRQAFIPFGTVALAHVLRDECGHSLGLGIVHMARSEDVERVFNVQRLFEVSGLRVNVWEPAQSKNLHHQVRSWATILEMLGRFQHDVIALKPEAVIVWGFNNNVHRSDRAPIGQTLKRTRGKPSVHGCIWRNRRGLPRFLPRKSLDERLEGLNMWIGAILAKDGYQDYVNRHVAEVNCWIRDTATREGIMLLDLEAVAADQQGLR